MNKNQIKSKKSNSKEKVDNYDNFISGFIININKLYIHLKDENYQIEEFQDNPSNPSILFIGDHIEYDIQAPKEHMYWETLAIVEELEDLEKELEWKMNTTENQYNNEEEIIRFNLIILVYFYFFYREHCYHSSFNKYWSSFFVENNKKTIWCHKIQHYSSFYVPSLNRVARFPVNQLFNKNYKRKNHTTHINASIFIDFLLNDNHI